MRGHCGSIVAVCILYELKYKLVKLYNYFVVSFHLNRKLLNILQYKANSRLKVEAVASVGFSKTETIVMLQKALLKKTACSECCQHWFYVIKSRICFEKRNCKNDLVQLETCDSVFLKHVQFRTFFFPWPSKFCLNLQNKCRLSLLITISNKFCGVKCGSCHPQQGFVAVAEHGLSRATAGLH